MATIHLNGRGARATLSSRTACNKREGPDPIGPTRTSRRMSPIARLVAPSSARKPDRCRPVRLHFHDFPDEAAKVLDELFRTDGPPLKQPVHPVISLTTEALINFRTVNTQFRISLHILAGCKRHNTVSGVAFWLFLASLD